MFIFVPKRNTELDRQKLNSFLEDSDFVKMAARGKRIYLFDVDEFLFEHRFKNVFDKYHLLEQKIFEVYDLVKVAGGVFSIFTTDEITINEVRVLIKDKKITDNDNIIFVLVKDKETQEHCIEYTAFVDSNGYIDQTNVWDDISVAEKYLIRLLG